jgi:hypothetical protein
MRGKGDVSLIVQRHGDDKERRENEKQRNQQDYT